MLGLGKVYVIPGFAPVAGLTGATLFPLVSKKLTKDNNDNNLLPKMLGIQAAVF